MKYFRLVSKVAAIVVISITSCKKDSDVVPNLNGVEDQFKEYVLRFVAEAKARNVSVDVSRVTIKAVSQKIVVGGTSFCGYTFSTLPADVNIQIADVNGCWSDQTDANKEILIFHELGHGVLGRSHDDTLLPSGLRKTIMFPTSQYYMYSQFTPALRSYYLDELFNVNTPVPSFGKVRANSTVILQDSVATVTSWIFGKSDASLAHAGDVSSTVFASPHHSLAIVAQPGGSSDQFSFFFKSIPAAGVAGGSELVLKVKIRTVNLASTATVVVRADYQNQQAAFFTTQNMIAISGTQDFTEYAVKMTYFPEKADVIKLYLLLTGPANGTVYFDDVQLVNNY